jgi:hypothetical protein
LIRNIETGYVSPQFHVVFDERFEKITTDMSLDLEETWVNLFKTSRDVFLDWYDESCDGSPPELDPDYAANEDIPEPTEYPEDVDESIVNDQDLKRRGPVMSVPTIFESNENASNDVDTSRNQSSNFFMTSVTTKPAKSGILKNGSRLSQAAFRPIKSYLFSHIEHVATPTALELATIDWETIGDDPICLVFHEMFCRFLSDDQCELLDPDGIHPFALASKLQNADFPSFQDIMRMKPEERDLWLESMDEEIKALFDQGTLEFARRTDVEASGEEIVKTTWAFRKKRKPSGELSRRKSRLCVRGDLQKGVYNTNETFAPVVEWSTIRMVFSLALLENWATASIDFKNAFAQATLPKPIYLDLPPGYLRANPQHNNLCLKVKRSLYGDRRAANLWYRKLRESLESPELGFKVSTMDPCLFMRHDCLIVLYVDDACCFAKSENVIGNVLSTLDRLGYGFSRDGSFSQYLGIQVNHQDDGTIKLSQPGLKRNIIDVMGLQDANSSPTPISTPLFKHLDSPPFDESFNYRSALGMLQYVGNNTHPECAYAINSCARYCIEPKQAHGAALKRIARYLKGCLDDGLIIRRQDNLSLDCHCDSDFAGNYIKTDNDDPASVRSRTGFLITFGTVPILWKSKIQTEIALSSMEAEYIALSTAMRSLIHLRSLLFEIADSFNLQIGSRISTISTVFEDNNACRILATTDPPRLTPRSKSLAVKYHWFREHLSEDTIVIKDVASADQKGDGFTKPKPQPAFLTFRRDVCGW